METMATRFFVSSLVSTQPRLMCPAVLACFRWPLMIPIRAVCGNTQRELQGLPEPGDNCHAS